MESTAVATCGKNSTVPPFDTILPIGTGEFDRAEQHWWKPGRVPVTDINPENEM
jgi:hypothetical protein